MKRKTIEKIWIGVVLLILTIMLIMICIGCFQDNLTEMESHLHKLSICSIPINLIFLIILSNKKD